MPFQFNRFDGIEGTVTVPSIGSVAGIIGKWTLRREENGPNAGLYSLHAVLSYANEALLRDTDFAKEVSLLLRRNRATGDEDRVTVSGGSLSFYDMQLDISGVTVNASHPK
jgi:hypothetical protein